MLNQAAVFIHILSAVIWLGRRWRSWRLRVFFLRGTTGASVRATF